MTDLRGPSRREFLAASTAAAAATALPGLALAQPAAPAPPPPPPPSPAAAASGITAEMVAAAEKLAGIEFTPAKREMLAKSIGDQIERFKHRQTQPLPANTLAPALTFDPRLPGMKLDGVQRPIVRTAAPMPLPDVPGDDEAIAFAPVKVLSRWIEARALTSTRLTEIYLERLKRLDSKLRFVITLTEDLARRQAARADSEIAAGTYRGPLHGIPWGAKDLLDTAGIRTTWGAEPYVDRVPMHDATVVKKLEEAGAVLAAKTTLGALAYGDIWHGGRTNNPWNIEKGSSGSSAGSAAAVASGCVGFAIGTETLGSIISPSRVCGSTGLRPTFGRVSRAGAMALCWSLDKIGPMARCSEDTALVLAAINGYDAQDSCSLDMPFNFDAGAALKGLRVGYIPAAFERPNLHSAHKQCLELLRAAGCELVEFSLPEWPFDVLMNILVCEGAAAFEELTRPGTDDTLKWQAPEAWPNTFRETWFVPGVELVQSHRFRRQCMNMMKEKMEGVDLVLDPTNTGPLCIITNNTGHPSLTIRVGFGDDGLPRATTLVGRLFDEGALIRVGNVLEAGLGVWEKRPVL
ncbi:MAG: amidase [Phycisphaerales bacterium]